MKDKILTNKIFKGETLLFKIGLNDKLLRCVEDFNIPIKK